MRGLYDAVKPKLYYAYDRYEDAYLPMRTQGETRAEELYRPRGRGRKCSEAHQLRTLEPVSAARHSPQPEHRSGGPGFPGLGSPRGYLR
ncbi:MAG: hypothetical protein ACP5HT_07460 [Conexivisphaera sp.]